MKRRNGDLVLLKEENLFNPNVKTIFVVDDISGIVDIVADLQCHRILIREHV
jgi:hypothetical protein